MWSYPLQHMVITTEKNETWPRSNKRLYQLVFHYYASKWVSVPHEALRLPVSGLVWFLFLRAIPT